jgi:hypothetical protein
LTEIDWLPIETAPKDATPVILAVTGGPRGPVLGEARWHDDDYGGDWWWAGTSPGDYGCSSISEIQFGKPTHWMPMPPAPKDQCGQTEERSDGASPAAESQPDTSNLDAREHNEMPERAS